MVGLLHDPNSCNFQIKLPNEDGKKIFQGNFVDGNEE